MKKVVCALLVLAPMVAFGGEGEGITTRSDLETLKRQCKTLEENKQIMPFDVMVTCREVRYRWEVGQPTTTQLPNAREVGAEIKMKNFFVPYSGAEVAVPASSAECTVLDRYKEVVGGVSVTLNCEELEQVQNLSQFCVPYIEEHIAQNPDAVQKTKTGETFNTCSGLGK